MSGHAPAVVWIDARIAGGLSTVKDEELAERGVDQIRYVAQERVDQLVRSAGGPAEFIIQIFPFPTGDGCVGPDLVALTTLGRLFQRYEDGWMEQPLPDLEA